MKTVVLEIVEETVLITRTHEDKYYLCANRSIDHFWVLVKKVEGYIFISINNRSGHSGYSQTIPTAIQTVLKSPSTRDVLEFDTFLELAQYVVKHQGTK